MTLFSCKNKAKDAGSEGTATPAAEQTTPAAETKPATNEPKTLFHDETRVGVAVTLE
jgi:hypothetical protein